MNKVRACGAISLLALSLPLHAEDWSAIASKPYISEMLSYQIANSDRQSDNGVGGVLSGSIPINKFFNIELGGAYTHFNGDGSTPSYVWKDYDTKLDGLFFYSRNPKFAPYFDLGVGLEKLRNKTTSQADSAWYGDAGVGFIKYFHLFGSPFGFRADARYRLTFADSAKFPGTTVSGTMGEPILSVGLVIPLGFSETKTEAPIPVAPVPTPVPKPQPVAESPNRKFDDIHFAFDKSDLTDYSKALLDQDATTIGKLAGQYTDLKVDVAGHTDWIGTDAYNQALSERRANAAKDYLIHKGVDATRIRTYAYGESQPIATNRTTEGRALNRRDEVRTTVSP